MQPARIGNPHDTYIYICMHLIPYLLLLILSTVDFLVLTEFLYIACSYFFNIMFVFPKVCFKSFHTYQHHPVAPNPS
jgi:hypothetical protein